MRACLEFLVILVLASLLGATPSGPPAHGRATPDPPATTFSSAFTVEGISPGMTRQEVEAQCGEPAGSVQPVVSYAGPVWVVYHRNQVRFVGGRSLSRGSVRLFQVGDPAERARKLLGTPRVEAGDPYSLAFPGGVIVQLHYDRSTIAGVCLRECRSPGAVDLRTRAGDASAAAGKRL